VDLRQRIAVCFSVGELRALADSLGVGGVPWDRGIQEAAREVVRQSERYAGLPALVAKLREVRPLMEWPEPAAAAQPALKPLPTTLASEIAQVQAPPALSASPGTLGPAPPQPLLQAPPPQTLAAQAEPSQAPPLVDPYAAPPGPRAIQVPRPTAGTAWPGVTGEAPAKAPTGGIDPRIFFAVAGLMVVAALIAYLAGRASTASAPPDAAAASPSGSPAPARAGGPAALAAGALARSFANLARECELPASAGVSSLVIQRAFERCGPGAPPRRVHVPTPSSSDPSAPATPTAEPAQGKGRRQGRAANGAPTEAPPVAKGCTGACDATHAACRAHCGPEPQESSAYEGYERCLGRCLSEASRCRLSCR